MTSQTRQDSDLSVFLGQLIRRPREISAIVPSSDILARAMAREVPPGPGSVVELGPGTGKITRALLETGQIAPADLHLVELNHDFVGHLRSRFEGVAVHHARAQDLPRLGVGPLRCVVSGLPLLSFPPLMQLSILRAALSALAPGAPFIQFTYGPAQPLSPRLMRVLRLNVSRRARIWNNLPPARIYAYHRGEI